MTSRRWGRALWVGCLQFFVAEAVAAAGFVGSYSFHRNYISDLGALSCGAGCSPLHPLMNASFVLQGVLIFAGAFVVWPLFPRGALSRLALGLVAASGLGVALVGLAIPRSPGTISEPPRTSCSAMRAPLSSAWRSCARARRRGRSGSSRWLLA